MTTVRRARGITTVFTGVAVAVGWWAAAGTATAANLINKGGTSSVPTYEDRIYLIKNESTITCPSASGGFNCFCNSGSSCTLPGTGAITGTVIVDRLGVTLDCQNRIIQAPRFVSSAQVCTASSQCGTHGTTGKSHVCVNGFCQLDNLAGINIGGPVDVDDSGININVNATGFIQNVDIINCKVRFFARGYGVDGFTGDNGNDGLDIEDSEFWSNNDGIDINNTDASWINSVWSHDNSDDGIDADYNWGLNIWNTVSELNADKQVGVSRQDGTTVYNRWLTIAQSSFWTTSTSADNAIEIKFLEAANDSTTQCNLNLPNCDVKFEDNFVHVNNNADSVQFNNGGGSSSFPGSPKVQLRNNAMWNTNTAKADVEVQSGITLTRVCWNKGNTCFNSYNGSTPVSCTQTSLFTSSCWY